MAKNKKVSKLSSGMSTVKSVTVKTVKANSELIDTIIDETIDQWTGGADWEDCLAAVQTKITDEALKTHSPRVRAGLVRAGLDVPTDGELTTSIISSAVTQKTGIDFGGFSPREVLNAVDAIVAKQLSEASGLEINSVIGSDLQDVIKAAVRAGLRTGTFKRAFKAGLEARARGMATRARIGSNAREFKKLRNRKNQAEYRKTHVQKWI